PITIPNSTVTTTEITGMAVNCDSDPVTNGFARIKIGSSVLYVELEPDGSFSATGMNCDESDVEITVVDEDALKQSLPQSYTYAAVIDAGTITVCEALTEFISLEVEGVVDPYVFFLPYATVQQTWTQISSFDSTTQQQYFFVSFNGAEPGIYTDVSAEIGLELPGGAVIYSEDVTITITYFGDVGDVIQGTLTGTMIEPGGGGPQYSMTGSFTVLRE
ncbi:MAG: hypothetical protein R3330_17910, partial [Saprospiraceae bacterium]|nr:hypothetical protein [Saprospiraceae bacterium]